MWSEGAADVAVLIETTTDDCGSLAEIAAQLPDPAALQTNATLVVLARAVQNVTSWRRWLGRRSIPVPRALRCTALLVRGYVDIGATSEDEDLAWGRARGD